MEFRCPDPTALVRGANVKATLDAFKDIPTLGRSYVHKYFQPDEMREDYFVPVQRWLDALKEIQDEAGITTLREVGRHLVENADFPPQYKTVKEVLLALDTIHHLNHKGEVGHYRIIEEPFTNTLVVRCETPYPRAFERGLVEGICATPRLLKPGEHFQVRTVDAPVGGKLTCTVYVRSM